MWRRGSCSESKNQNRPVLFFPFVTSEKWKYANSQNSKRQRILTGWIWCVCWLRKKAYPQLLKTYQIPGMHYRYAIQVCMTVHCDIWHSPDLRNDLSLATELTRNGACAINLSVKVCCEHPPPVATNLHSHKCSGAYPNISEGGLTISRFGKNCSLKKCKHIFWSCTF